VLRFSGFARLLAEKLCFSSVEKVFCGYAAACLGIVPFDKAAA
jgi:hypothetical protein